MIRGFAACLLLSFSINAAAEDTGTIDGVLLDENGRGVAAAMVSIDNIRDKAVAFFGVLRTAETDINGQFVFSSVKWGSYLVGTQKESDGYPNTMLEFYRNGDPETIALSPLRPGTTVIVYLNSRAARIGRITVTDAITQQAVATAGIELSRVERTAGEGMKRTSGIDTSADSKPFIPARTPVSVVISAPGYADWYYPGVNEFSKSIPVLLEPGETLSFNVSLLPVSVSVPAR